MFTIFILFVCTVVGFILRKAGLIPDGLKDLLYKYVYFIAVPAAIIYSLSGQLESGVGKYAVFLAANLCAYFAVFVGMTIYAKSHGYPYKTAGVMRFSSTAPNSIFLGFPLILALFDSSLLIYAVILGSLSDTIMNVVKIVAIKSGSSKKSRQSTAKLYLRNLLNPLAAALVVACIMAVANFELPDGLGSVLRVVGKTSPYIALIVLGASIVGLKLRRDDNDEILSIALVKLVILPAAVLATCLLVGMDEEARDISVIISALPVAIFSLIVADNLKLENRIATGAIMITTIMAPITLLCWYLFLQVL